MPEQWSKKRERQYDKIRKSARERGESPRRAKEIASRTVNKERARSGESKQASRTSTKDVSSGAPRRQTLGTGFRGSHAGPALQRGEAARHQRPLEDE
jgi:hypothetical protein